MSRVKCSKNTGNENFLVDFARLHGVGENFRDWVAMLHAVVSTVALRNSEPEVMAT
jgi:hypothetical protein